MAERFIASDLKSGEFLEFHEFESHFHLLKIKRMLKQTPKLIGDM